MSKLKEASKELNEMLKELNEFIMELFWLELEMMFSRWNLQSLNEVNLHLTTSSIPVNLHVDHAYKMLDTQGKLLCVKEKQRSRLALPYADLMGGKRTRRFQVNCKGLLPVEV